MKKTAEGEFFKRDREGIKAWLKTSKTSQEFRKRFYEISGWTLALVITDPEFVRFQLQSEPPESEDTGEIKCVTGKDFIDTTLKALEFCKPSDTSTKERGGGMNTGQSSATAAPEGKLRSDVSCLEAYVEKLQQAVQSLSTKLEPIRTSMPQNEGNRKDDVRGATSSLSQRIMTQNERIEIITSAINVLNGELDI